MELEVLKSNNWNRFRPSYILLESHLPIEKEIESDITLYLKCNKYILVEKTLQGHHLGTLWFRAE